MAEQKDPELTSSYKHIKIIAICRIAIDEKDQKQRHRGHASEPARQPHQGTQDVFLLKALQHAKHHQ